ncbi:hypothetical protein JZ751_009668 [Albula glossodonta]|uniref:Uncharacterized protein n=1 Tax=Albula glossodonta TaxID=121402 RepID=A0A8T2NXS7_9TELE|nr:hypothetical protein JZ751_009668 [Albula glossodonta]
MEPFFIIRSLITGATCQSIKRAVGPHRLPHQPEFECVWLAAALDGLVTRVVADVIELVPLEKPTSFDVNRTSLGMAERPCSLMSGQQWYRATFTAYMFETDPPGQTEEQRDGQNERGTGWNRGVE